MLVLARVFSELEFESVLIEVFCGGWYFAARLLGGTTGGPRGGGFVEDPANSSSFFLSNGVYLVMFKGSFDTRYLSCWFWNLNPALATSHSFSIFSLKHFVKK